MTKHLNDLIRRGQIYGGASAPTLLRFSGRSDPGGSTAELELTFNDDAGSLWALVRAHVKQYAGNAENLTMRLGHAAAFAEDSINEDIVWLESAVLTPINDIPVVPIPVALGTDGKLWLRFGWDNGTDNEADYEFFFQRIVTYGEGP